VRVRRSKDGPPRVPDDDGDLVSRHPPVNVERRYDEVKPDYTVAGDTTSSRFPWSCQSQSR
jgi:hypothetical protein